MSDNLFTQAPNAPPGAFLGCGGVLGDRGPSGAGLAPPVTGNGEQAAFQVAGRGLCVPGGQAAAGLQLPRTRARLTGRGPVPRPPINERGVAFRYGSVVFNVQMTYDGRHTAHSTLQGSRRRTCGIWSLWPVPSNETATVRRVARLGFPILFLCITVPLFGGGRAGGTSCLSGALSLLPAAPTGGVSPGFAGGARPERR